MDYINDLMGLKTGLLILINTGVVVRVIACVIQASGNFDDRTTYLKRAKNALIFMAIANSLIAIKDLLTSYFPG